MAACRKQALQEQEIDDILNESEIEDEEDDEDPTYQEPELDRAYENVDEHFSTSENEDFSSSGDETSIPSTSNYWESSSRAIPRRRSVRTRGGVLHRNAVHNSNMGGVDLTDRLLAVCPSRMRTKKWTVRFISHFIDLSVVNAWIKYKADQKLQGVRSHKIFQLRAFKQSIAEKILDDYLLEENDIERATVDSSYVLDEEVSQATKRGRPPVKAIPSAAFRKRGSLHLPAMGTSQHRCRQKSCVMKTTIYCQACDLPLCFTAKRNCFADFHLVDSSKFILLNLFIYTYNE